MVYPETLGVDQNMIWWENTLNEDSDDLEKSKRPYSCMMCFYWYQKSAGSWKAIPWEMLYPTRQNGSSVAPHHCNTEEDRSITLQQRD